MKVMTVGIIGMVFLIIGFIVIIGSILGFKQKALIFLKRIYDKVHSIHALLWKKLRKKGGDLNGSLSKRQ